MSFLNPQYLYGLIALVIPILIHLFNLRKTRKVYFSNTRFLRMAQERSARKRKLKHYLILASRLLFITFLVLAFAQPFIPAEEEASAGNPVIIYLDNSYSMSNEVEEDLTAFDQAVDYISALLGRMPEGTRYRLLTNDFLPGSSALESDREVEERLTELSYSGITRSYSEIARRIHSFRETYGPVNIFWISDFQQSTASGDEQQEFGAGEDLQLMPLTFRQLRNAYVDSVYQENPLMIGDQQLKLYATLRNTGNEPVNDLIVKVYLDEVQSATASIDLPPNGSATVDFDLAFTTEEVRQGRVSIEEFPVTFDNDFYFSLSRPERIGVLEIRENAGPTPVESVYGNEDLFDFSAYSADNLDYNLIGNSALVVLNGLQSVDAPLAAALNRYLQQNGTLLVIPAADPDIASYRLLTGLQDVFARDSAGTYALEVPDFNNPFYANIFEERNSRMEMPRATPTIGWQNRGNNLLRFNAGNPFLVERTGNGSIFMMAAPAEASYNGFIRHALFVPVMYKIAAGSLREGKRLYRYLDETTFAIPADRSGGPEALYKLIREDFEIIPQQRTTGNQVFFDIPPQTLRAGFYQLGYAGETAGQLAFNYSPAESDLRQIPVPELMNYFTGEKIVILETGDTAGFEETLEERYVGRNLWKYMVILALLALLAEVALIRFMS